jgi:hypothetical protein
MSDARRELVVMRLINMTVVHPQQDNSRRCSKCLHQVGIYPSGQAALRRYPDMPIVCTECTTPEVFDTMEPAARSREEFNQEHSDSVPVKHAD